MARPKKIIDPGMDQPLQKVFTAKDTVSVINITSSPVQFSGGVIKPGEKGMASYSEACTFINHIKIVE